LRFLPVALACLAAASLCAAATPAQAATPAVQFTPVWYDSPGSDRGSNTSLNGEYVRIRNTTRKTISLRDWTLRDKTGYRFTFPKIAIKPGKTITVRTGKGHSGTSTLYWGRGWYVWNNNTDAAYLRNVSGKLIDSCSWKSSRSDYTNC
jgi:Intermediate filament tail domain.